MNPVSEIWLIVSREVRKSLRSVKGLILIALSILGAFASTFRVPKIEGTLADAQELGPEALHAAKAKLFTELYGNEATGDRLADAPLKLVLLFYLAVWFAPLLVVLLGFDGLPSDLQYRSVRYWTVRSRRTSYYVGKFLGLWLVVGAITLLMYALIWTVTIARGDATAVETLTWGLRFLLVSLAIAAAWCGIAMLVSSFFRTPMLALLVTCAAFFGLFFVGVVLGRSRDNAVLQGVYPNGYDAWMLSPDVRHALAGLAITVAFAAVTTTAGAMLFARRDV